MINPINSQYIFDSQPSTAETQIFNQIKKISSEKEQLKKVASEFESIFTSKMFALLDKTVDREGGAFGGEGKFAKTFKSFMYNEIGREISSNPRTSFGIATQIYNQMEKYIRG